MKNAIKDLIDISAYAGARADYTQGGGGNTSVKNDEKGVMLIKASGYRAYHFKNERKRSILY